MKANYAKITPKFFDKFFDKVLNQADVPVLGGGVILPPGVEAVEHLTVPVEKDLDQVTFTT